MQSKSQEVRMTTPTIKLKYDTVFMIAKFDKPLV